MSLKDILFTKKEEKRFYFNNKSTAYKMANTLNEWLPEKHKDIVIICIGTDRSTGDSLGPLVGSLLSEQKLNYLSVYGTLDSPVHAKNLGETLEHINDAHANPIIIAVDACLGKQNSVGSIVVGVGPLRPGAAVKKQLPEVGEFHISGIVNISGYMEYFVLQNTRLSIVMNMAKEIARSLRFLDFFLHKEKNNTKNLV